MLEKLNIHFSNINKKFSLVEIELFIELISNYVQWNHILEIMNLENDDLKIINRINKEVKSMMIKCETKLSKIHRYDWILKKTQKQKIVNDYFNKSFTYPAFLFLISLNLLTFLLIYVLPSMIESFSSISNNSNSYNFILVLSQFLIGLEWGILLIIIYLKYRLNQKQILKLYIYFYNKFPNNLWVYMFSYYYLFDFLYFVNLDINIETTMNILNSSDSILYKELSESILHKLKNGYSIKNAFSLIDLTFIKILQIDDFERKFNQRLENYLNVLLKQIEINIKKYSSYFMSLVYIQIGFMVLLVYSILLYPLKLIEVINI